MASNSEKQSPILSPSSPDLRLYDAADNESPSWEKMAEETQINYSYFVYYRDLGRTRTIRAAYEAYISGELKAGRTPSAVRTQSSGFPRRWGEYSTEFNWRERAEAYDDFMEIEGRNRRLRMQDAEIEEYRLRARQIAIAQTNFGAKFLMLGDTLLTRMQALDQYAE